MILNRVFIENLRPRDRKRVAKTILSCYAHFEDGDRKFIQDNISEFLNDGDTVFFPIMDQHIPSTIRHFALFLKSKGKYNIEYLPYTSREYLPYNATVVGNDVLEMAFYASKYQKTQQWRLISSMIDQLSDAEFEYCMGSMQDVIKSLSGYIGPGKEKANLQYYCKCLLTMSKSCDAIMSIRTTSILQSNGYNKFISICLSDWARVIDTMVESLFTGECKTDSTSVILNDLLTVEFLYFQSVIPQKDLIPFAETYCITPKVATMLGHTESIHIKSSFERLLCNIQKSTFFSYSTFGKTISNAAHTTVMWGYHPPINEESCSIEKDELVKSLTKERICEIINDRTTTIITPDDITFDIASNMLAMWQKEFGSMYRMIPYETKDDGWRFLIDYQGKLMVGFGIQNDHCNKIYGATVVKDLRMGIDTWTLVEFSGVEGMNYRAIF